MISQNEMLRKMLERDAKGNFKPFAITWVTLSERENTGGEKITLAQAVFVGGPSKKEKEKNPQHYANYTRNIRALEGDRMMTVRVDLITRFNGMRIIL